MTNRNSRLEKLESARAAADGRWERVITWNADDTITRTRRPLAPGQDAPALRVNWETPDNETTQTPIR